MSKYINYYETDDNKYIIIYSDKPEKLYKVSKLPDYKTYHRFSMLASSGLKPNNTDLRKYYELFKEWTTQLQHNDIFTFDYLRCKTDNDAVKRYFHITKQGNNTSEPINATESKWFERCYNAMLLYCEPGEYKDVYSYDFSFNYPTCLASRDFWFPISSGYEITLKKIAEKSSNIQVGFYHVKITCDNENFRKLFAFSKNHVYDHQALRFANDRKEKYSVNIELIQDGQPNHYQYKKNVFVKGNDVFYLWFNKLVELRKAFPDNKLIKHLASSLWGSLSKKYLHYKTEQEIIDEQIDIGETYDIVDEQVDKQGNHITYILIELNKLYASNYRLKPFITSFARCKTAKFAEQDVNNVVRVHTDCVSFTRKQQIHDKSLRLETKYTGHMIFKNITHCEKIE
jgi:hypothetical protein